ncbi:MAG: cytochrome c family protein [Sedimentisphaerales bacterium]
MKSAPLNITIFFTGNELGSMKPCGCSGGQLGGLERLDAVFNTVPSQNRLILDTGALVPESTEQNLIKFNVIVQAFGLLGYDVVNLTGQDITIARQAGLIDGLNRLFNCITSAPENQTSEINFPMKFTKQFSSAEGPGIDVTILTADTAEQLTQLKESVNPSSNAVVFILILANPDLIEAASNLSFIDSMLIPPHSDEPTLISEVNKKPVIIAQGRLGKYVGQINIDIDSSSQPAKPQLSFRSVAVTEDLAQNQSLVELYRDYQRLVKEARLLEKHPKFPLPAHLQYVGSKSCKLCHDYEYQKWLTSPPVVIPGEKTTTQKGRHANAMLSLVDVNSDYDPECVVCHVIGMDYETGFITSAQTPQLEDVGCENCHGPGSEHVRSLGAIQTAGPKSTCTDCHTSEHSADYLANEKQYNDKVIHWRPPKAPQIRRRIIGEPNSPKIVK